MKLLKTMVTECFRRASVLNQIFSWFDNGPIPWHLSSWFWISYLSKGWLKILCQKVDFSTFAFTRKVSMAEGPLIPKAFKALQNAATKLIFHKIKKITNYKFMWQTISHFQTISNCISPKPLKLCNIMQQS